MITPSRTTVYITDLSGNPYADTNTGTYLGYIQTVSIQADTNFSITYNTSVLNCSYENNTLTIQPVSRIDYNTLITNNKYDIVLSGVDGSSVTISVYFKLHPHAKNYVDTYQSDPIKINISLAINNKILGTNTHSVFVNTVENGTGNYTDYVDYYTNLDSDLSNFGLNQSLYYMNNIESNRGIYQFNFPTEYFTSNADFLNNVFSFTKLNSNNLFKIEDERKPVWLEWMFYNNTVVSPTIPVLPVDQFIYNNYQNNNNYNTDPSLRINFSNLYTDLVQQEVIFYITPIDETKLTFTYNKDDISDIPEVNVIDVIDNNQVVSMSSLIGVMLNQISYSNTEIESGMCRGFRFTVETVDSYGIQTATYDLDNTSTDYTNPITFYGYNSSSSADNSKAGDVETANNIQIEYLLYQHLIKPGGLENKRVRLTVSAYFYFGNESTSEKYIGATKTLPYDLFFMTRTSTLNTIADNVTLDFPIYDTGTQLDMTMPVLTRAGYDISILSDFVNIPGYSFGVDIVPYNGQTYSYSIRTDELNDYISNTCDTILKDKVIFDIGNYVLDWDTRSLYGESSNKTLYVQPFIELYRGTSYYTKISVTYAGSTKPSISYNISESVEWIRQTPEKGQYITYTDADKFLYFVNQYPTDYFVGSSPLASYYNGPFRYYTDAGNSAPNIIENSKASGSIINENNTMFTTANRYWNSIIEKLKSYAEYMQSYIGDYIENYFVLWKLPTENYFISGVQLTNNNIYQNYYDILMMLNGKNAYTTHEYLNENNYTHEQLANYSYQQITNKIGF